MGEKVGRERKMEGGGLGRLHRIFSLLRDLKWTKEPRCKLASYLKHCKPLIGDALRYT
jgi:hypothetical protein